MTAATAAVGAFAKASIDTGAQFDSSMSQVAATMGTTVDQIQELRDFAQDMGAKTAFSATQAADALNYMALAGYDAEQSMEALPNVLNLAAAGGIDLAAASDMVTDAQSALGLSMKESAELIDKMAVASSKSNTSVAQLGDAILTIGGTAKNLAGGTTELSTALGILADNGIKGAEGGTALRNIILSLSAPTDKAAASLEAMGVAVYDAEGNMRPLNDTFSDLEAALSTMTQGEQTNVLNDIFNKVDLKSVNALLANTGERFDELSGYINEASGAAEAMAATQLDNLTGDITLMKSALEGAQILLSDKLSPYLREFVQFGTGGITQIADAFKEGGLSGAMSAFGTVLSDGLNMVIEMLPQAVDAGMQLLDALGQGILDNLPVIIDAGVKITVMLVNGLISALPKLISAVPSIISALVGALSESLPELLASGKELLGFFSNGISEAIPDLIAKLPEVIDSILRFITSKLPGFLDKGMELLEKFAFGILEYIPQMVAQLPAIISGITGFITDNFPVILEKGGELLGQLLAGILGAIPEIAVQLPAVIDAIVDALKAGWEMLKEAGGYLLEGLWNGISDKIGWLKSKVTGVVDTIKGWFTGSSGFDEHSPSKWANQVFRYVMEGGGEGLEEGLPGLMGNVSNVVDSVKSGMKFGTANVDFAASGIGQSSAAIINSATGGEGGNVPVIPLTINLLTGESRPFAEWILGDLIAVARERGTPITSGTQYA